MKKEKQSKELWFQTGVKMETSKNLISTEKILNKANLMTCWQKGIVNLRVLYTASVCSNIKFDPSDIVILSWFLEFSMSDKMRKKKLYSEKDKKFYDDFFFVSYSGIISQNPILGINSRRTIARRFENYCNAGIMDFCLLKSAGTFTYYRLKAPFNNLLLSHEADAYKMVPKVYGYEWDFSQDENPTSLSQMDCDELRGGQISTAGCSFTDSRVDAQEHSNNCVVNDCIVTTDNVNTFSSEDSEKNEIQTILFSLFGERANSFSADICKKVITVCNDKGIEKERIPGFLKFVMEWTKKKIKDESKILGYFYKCAGSCQMAESYLANQKPFYDEKPLPEVLESIW